MRALTIESTKEIGVVERAWDELADRGGVTPFVQAGWLRAWWNAFGSGELEVFTARRGDELVGVVPIRRLRGRIASPTNYHTAEFSLVADNDEARAVLIRAVFERAARSVEMGYLVIGEADYALVTRAAAERGWSTLERPERSPFVDTTISWDAYAKGLSGNLRNDVRRRRRRLEEAGAVVVDIETGGERLDQLLEEGFRVESSGWKAAGGTAIASSPGTQRFYTDVARWAADRGWLRLCFLRLDGHAIAFHFDLEAGNVTYHLKGGYDPAHRQFSPSKVLHHEILERAFASDCKRYDFLGGDEPYKEQFSTGVRMLSVFRAFAPTAAGRAEDILVRRGRPLAKRLLALARVRD